jgi:hypothetical protein
MLNRLLTTATMAALTVSFIFVSLWVVGGLLVALVTR